MLTEGWSPLAFLIALAVACGATVAASMFMFRASNRSALANMGLAALLVLGGLAGVLVLAYLVTRAATQ